MSDHIVLTSHARRDKPAEPIHWGAPTAAERGPVIASLTDPAQRNVIGTHAGAYAIYRALAVAAGTTNEGLLDGSLAEAASWVSGVLADPELRSELGEASRDLAEQEFALAGCATRFERLLAAQVGATTGDRQSLAKLS